MNRKSKIWLGCLALLVLILGTAASFLCLWPKKQTSPEAVTVIGGADGPTAIFIAEKPGEDVKTDWDTLVSDTIFSENQGKYTGEECSGEGHLILQIEEDGEHTKLYVLTMYGEYQFQDGNFVKEAGTGVIPAVITCAKTNSGEYLAESCDVPEDGSGYVESIHRLFPENLWEICLSPADEIRETLEAQERRYASDYLKTLGREAVIGEYGDFSHPLLTEEGVSVEVSNRLCGEKILAPYPFWIGSVERLEDGVRYEYRVELKEEQGRICYTKTNPESREVVEAYIFDVKTGDRLEE